MQGFRQEILSLADWVGDYIFADEKFVHNLYAGDRNDIVSQNSEISSGSAEKVTKFSLSPETSQGVDRIALENIAPTREQIAATERTETPAKTVDTGNEKNGCFFA